MAMTHPMIIWYGIVAFVLLIFAIDFIHYLVTRRKCQHRHAHSFISMGHEREMVFAPGDPSNDNDESLQDDYEDL